MHSSKKGGFFGFVLVFFLYGLIWDYESPFVSFQNGSNHSPIKLVFEYITTSLRNNYRNKETQ